MPKRRAHGSGSIQQTRAGYWRLTVSAGRDPVTDKRRRVVRYVRGSRRQAEQELRKLLDEISDAPPPPRAYTVADLLDDWFREMEPDWAAQTRMVREADVRHLKCLLGDIRLLELTPRAVQAAVDRMREQGYAPRTIHRRMTALRGLGMIRRDPMMGVRLPKLPPKQPRILTQDQVAALAQAAQSTRWGLAILLAAHTGMRIAEILGLRWSDIDWERGLIRVEQIVIYRACAASTCSRIPNRPHRAGSWRWTRPSYACCAITGDARPKSVSGRARPGRTMASCSRRKTGDRRNPGAWIRRSGGYGSDWGCQRFTSTTFATRMPRSCSRPAGPRPT